MVTRHDADGVGTLEEEPLIRHAAGMERGAVEDQEAFELPGDDLSRDDVTVRVLPKQPDEFTCTDCFLLHHRSQLARAIGGRLICRDCAEG